MFKIEIQKFKNFLLYTFYFILKIMLSIIIVSWNVKDLLKKCLESIYQNQGGLELEIFVVDNASTDGTPEMVKNNFPSVILIDNKSNRGFAAANNQAIKLAKGEYILILNPDTEIVSDAFQKSIEFMEQNQKTGILGCQILNPDKTIQPSVRRLPTFWPIFLIFLKLPKMFPNLPAVKRYLAAGFDYSKIQSVDQVMGAFMLIKKEVFEKIGLFDERFFLWFEEVDLCRRAASAGFEVLYHPEAKIIHYGGQSFSQQGNLKKQWMFFRSAVRYFLKTINKY